MSVIDTASNTVINTITLALGTSALPQYVTITPDGQYAYVSNTGAGDTNNTVSVIATDLNANAAIRDTVVSTITTGTAPGGVAFTANGQYAYVANTVSNTVSVINTALALTTPASAVISTLTVGTKPRAIAITPDGQYAYVTNQNDGTVSVIDLSDPANPVVVGTPIPVGNGPFDLRITSNGQFAYVSNATDGTVSVIDIASNTVVNTITVGSTSSTPVGIALTPDGQNVYAIKNTGTISVIDTATNTVVNTITLGGLDYTVTITPDGKFAYVSTLDSTTVTVIALGTAINATLPGGTPGAAYTGSVTATDPVGSTFTYSYAGSLPPGVTFDTATGQLSGTPTTAGNYPITVTATANDPVNGLAEAIVQPLVLTVLPIGADNTPYAGSIAVTNDTGAPDITCALSAGSTLPPGMTLTTNTTANTCDVSGTPTSPGTYEFGVTATSTVNGAVQTSTQPYTIAINPPGATAGNAYTQTLAVPHDPSTTFTCAVTGSLPPGVTFNTSTCQLSGTPTTPGSYTFAVTGTSTVNGQSQTTTQPYTLVVNPPDATVGVGYTDVIPVPHDVSTPITCTVKDGTLPPGVTLNQTTCQLSGTPTTPGTYNFTVTTTSTVGGLPTSTDQPFTIVVRAGAASIPTLSGMALLLLALLLGVSVVAVKRRGY